MKKTITTAILYTLITAIILGIGYPLLITGLDLLLFPHQADGSLITRNGQVIGSHLIGQAFPGDTYFHSRPSNAGAGYDPTSSGGSNLSSTSKALIDRVPPSTTTEQNAAKTPAPAPAPAITPPAASYQVPRIAEQRHLSEAAVTQLIDTHTTQRQFGLLGEPHVNVLELNLAL